MYDLKVKDGGTVFLGNTEERFMTLIVFFRE